MPVFARIELSSSGAGNYVRRVV